MLATARLGKPHPEQARIGTLYGGPPCVRVACEETHGDMWSKINGRLKRQNPAYTPTRNLERIIVSRAFVVCSSNFAVDAFVRDVASGYDVLIAVDAGLRHVLDLGLRPDVVLGDFDSFGHVPTAKDFPEISDAHVIVHPEEKDASDLELALDFLYDQYPQCDEVVIYGVLGGRLDQTIATLQTVSGFSKDLAITLISPTETVHVLSSGHTLTLTPQDDVRFVSVFSAVDASVGVSIQGLKYAFEGTLYAQGSHGLSNEFVGGEAHISVEDGILFVIEQR